MASIQERQSTLLLAEEKGTPPSIGELSQKLEKGSVDDQVLALKTVLRMTLNGEDCGPLLMTIIRFVLPKDEHALKKLTLLYFEVVEKTGADGKLLPEMILVCNYLRNDILHDNEYISGGTLRFVCKLREPEILEPLIASVISALQHRHAYVRRYAVLAIYSIYRNFETLIPHALDLIDGFLTKETDVSAKRNAFLMLFDCDQEKAVAYLAAHMDHLTTQGDILQLIIIDLVKRLCRSNPQERSRFVGVIFNLLDSPSIAVSYSCASALISLSATPTAIKAAATCYTRILTTVSDNNIKMIVLDRLTELKKSFGTVLEGHLMDIMRALNNPNMDIRGKVLEIALDLITPRNVDDVVALLKKEIVKTQSTEVERSTEYRQLLIQTVHSCAVKFPEVAQNVVHLLMDFLSDTVASSAVDVVLFVRAIVEKFPTLRASIVQKLLEMLPIIQTSRVFRVALFILGEYSLSAAEIDSAFDTLKTCLGPVPFIPDEVADPSDPSSSSSSSSDGSKSSSTSGSGSSGGSTASSSAVPQKSNRTRILSDGTYATETAHTDSSSASGSGSGSGSGGGVGGAGTGSGPVTPSLSPMRDMIVGGDFFLISSIATAMTKLCVRASTLGVERSTAVRYLNTSMLYMVAFLRLGNSNTLSAKMDMDTFGRISDLLFCLGRTDPSLQKIFLEAPKTVFAQNLKEEQAAEKKKDDKEGEIRSNVDSLLTFRQLKPRTTGIEAALDMDYEDISKATENAEKNTYSSKLNRIIQLTGMSDPVYAEAYVIVHQYDILLDVTVVNQTNDTLQNLCLELATVGDLKLTERPQHYTVAPFGRIKLRANIKVSSTETGIIFGNIVYDVAGSGTDHVCVILNDIHIDIMDYIAPGNCSDVRFRTCWAEFEWENKVAINTSMTDLLEFMNHIAKSTNMRVLTPQLALDGCADFLSANLYARSSFGEDALANLSIERGPNGKIQGFCRIRSKTQGIALSLGDKITVKQKAGKL